ncbi:MAG: hypothetical protein RIF39_18675, partial [Cyclobacteriaceae bacterium]
GFEEAIKLAVNAGVDILTFSNNIQGSEDRTVDRVHSIIKKYVMDGTIPASRIDKSFHRIMKLKERMGLSQADYYREEWLKAQGKFEAYKTKLEQSESELEMLKNKPTVIEKEETKKKKRKN